MRSKIFAFNSKCLILFLILTSLQLTQILSLQLKTEKTDSDRLDFYQKRADKISNGKLNFKFSPDKGIYTIANKDIKRNSITMKIPKDYILCDYDMFPFKFELKEAIISYFNSVKLSPQMEMTPSNIMLAYYLMFLRFEEKEKVFEKIRKEKMSYYIVEIKPQALEYLNTLPEYIYGISMYGNEEKLLLNKLGIPFENVDLDEVLMYTRKYIEKKYTKYKDYILPWLSDAFSFRYYLAVVHSRAKDVLLQDYELLIGKSFIETPMGVKHKDIMQDMLLGRQGSCIIPFVDLVNNYVPKFEGSNQQDQAYSQDNKPVKFSLTYDKNGAKFLVEKDFKKGEEYSYSYLTYQLNDNLLRKEGIYFDQDNFPDYDMKIVLVYAIRKDLLNEQKYKICTILNCLDSNIEEIYQNKNINQINIYIIFHSDQINERFLNLIRLQNISNHYVSIQENAIDVTKKLMKGQWISYDNEIASLKFYRKFFYDSLAKIDLKIPDILSSLKTTHDYFIQHKNEFELESNFYHKIQMREQILRVGKDNQINMYKNISFANKKIQKVLQDQFVKIRNYYSSDS